MSNGEAQADSGAFRRYIQLGVLTLAAGAVYPLVYLRQNFEVSILDSFGITISQLNNCSSLIGIFFIVTYLPSGWLADRASPRWLVSFSLGATGVLALWFSTMPSYEMLLIIFGGWGITTGLTFWAALIKGVAILARHREQGRFFGLLESGRGLVEAILATIAVALFAWWMNKSGQPVRASLQMVIYMYVGFALVLSPIVFFAIDDVRDDAQSIAAGNSNHSLWADLKTIVTKVEIWLAAFCITCGFQLFYATYSFSGYIQNIYGTTAVAAGAITVAKLWTRPIGPIVAGFIGDRFVLEKVLAVLMFGGSVALAALIALPQTANIVVLVAIVVIVGFMTYAIRGIFWATLDSCGIPVRIKGLAIGVMSLIGYLPEVYLPKINSILLEQFPGKPGYSIYYGGIVLFGLLGTLSAWRLHLLVSRREAAADS